jgi:hypothetical protein
MRILIACEFSGIVREAFNLLNHDAWSCDIKDTIYPGNHIKTDVLTILDDGWDLMIAFPPCTDLSNAGVQTWKLKQSDGRQQSSIDFFLKLYNCKIPRLCLENPAGIMSTLFRKPDQIIYPNSFGDNISKRTCLWLKNLPILLPVSIVSPGYYYKSSNGEMYPAWRWTTGKGDGDRRSIFFPGVAQAMARQWTDFINNQLKT